MMEEIMAGNVKDCNQGFQAAEAAIRDATDWLSTRRTKPDADLSASNNVYSRDAYTLGDEVTPATTKYDWDNNAIQFGELDKTAISITNRIGSCTTSSASSDGPLKDLFAPPCSVIEEHSFIPDDLDPDTRAKGIGRYYYRITSRGFGGTDKSQPRLEAILFQRYN
jgi:type IV pilus assembly protein PilX